MGVRKQGSGEQVDLFHALLYIVATIDKDARNIMQHAAGVTIYLLLYFH